MSDHSTPVHETYGLDAPLETADDGPEASASHGHHHDADGSNDHLASIYESTRDQFAAVVPFIEQGLERNERCLYVANDNTRAEVLEALRDGGVDVDAALESGALSVHTKADTYLRTGEFEREAMLEFWQETLAEARDEEGYDGVRAAAEMSWALDEGLDLDRLVRYEAALNRIYPGEDYVVLCQYDRERFPAGVIEGVVQSHPLVVYDGTVCENVHYQTPEAFFEDDGSSLDVDQAIESLVSRARARHALRESERQREEQLAALNALSRDLMGVESRTDVCDAVVDAAETTLDLPVAAIALYDGEAGSLDPAAATDGARELLAGAPVLERPDGTGWSAFAEGEPHRDRDLLAGTAAERDRSVTEIAAFPLGTHGVFVAGSTVDGGFGDDAVDFVGTVARNVEAALDRADREQQLREREATLRERTEALERLDRINGVIRGIDQALVGASTHEAVMQAVCDRLVETDAYRFAWVGTHDPVADRVTPEACAGDDDYLDRVEDDGGVAGDGPTVEAVRSREVQVRNHLAGDPPLEPWAAAGLECGYQACLAVPLRYGETVYGVLTVFAGRPDAFDGMERTVLAELGEIVGYALNALDRRAALVGEQSVELELQLRGGASPLFGLAAGPDCELEFESVVRRADAPSGLFVTIRGASPDEVLAAGERSPEIRDLTLVSDGEGDRGGALFECRVDDAALVSSVLDRGAMVRSFTATADEGRVVVRVPKDHEVRSLVDLFEAHVEQVDLLSLREVEEPVRTAREFEAELRTRLTERQEEILLTAYEAGFFDWPRETTAQDLAELLGISQPTVSRHIRAGERTLFDLVFDGE